MDIHIEFGRARIPRVELEKMSPGDVVALDQHSNEPVGIFAADELIARGELTEVDGNFGVRVTEVLARESTRPRAA